MTDKEKQTLLIDLCARLPYGAKCLVSFKDGTKHVMTLKTGLPNSFGKWDFYNERYSACSDDFKPYLRPMSSMTEEEWKELNCIGYIVPLYDGCFGVDMRAYCKNGQPHYRRFSEFSTIDDWLNAHHFDYRTIYDEDKKKYMSMIEKGLAIEAPEGMYNINKK